VCGEAIVVNGTRCFEDSEEPEAILMDEGNKVGRAYITKTNANAGARLNAWSNNKGICGECAGKEERGQKHVASRC